MYKNCSRVVNNKEKLENMIVDTIKKYDLIKKEDKIVVGVSGGPDSICLLDNLNRLRKEPKILLNECSQGQICLEQKTEGKQQYQCSNVCPHLNPEPVGTEPVGTSPFKPGTSGDKPGTSGDNLATFEIVVAHVNHMIREEASEDEQYVKEYCEKNKIEFYSKSIDVQKLANNNKIGTEEAGRIARYEFFDEILKKTNANKIAIAHNKNDKVETIIMHLLRGCGTNGLIGIEPKRGVYIRPLIECERKDIERYCEEQQLNPRIDKTNFENVYTRNKIRNVAIPYIQKEFNPNIIETIDRLSSLVSEEEEYMERQVKKAYDMILLSEKLDGKSEIILDLKKFNAQEKVIKSRVIRYTITKLFGSSKQIEQKHIEDIIKLCSNNIGNKYLTPNKNTKILIKNQKIYFSVNGKNP